MWSADFDYSKRDYLLPPGCKDIIDFLKFRDTQGAKTLSSLMASNPSQKPKKARAEHGPTPALVEITLPSSIEIDKLAACLGRRTFEIEADLIEIGVLPTSSQRKALLEGFPRLAQKLEFEIAARIALKNGFSARRAG